MTQPALATDISQPIDQDGVERTFVFCDVVGFSKMTERLGDRGALDVIRRYRSIVREAVHELHGEELELRGDGFLLAFGSPSVALECASAVRRQLAIDAVRHSAPVSVHIGVHTGHALRDGDGYFGRSLIVASRIADRAAAGEILVSEPCWNAAVAAPVSFECAGSRVLRLKGIRHAQRVLVAVGS